MHRAAEIPSTGAFSGLRHINSRKASRSTQSSPSKVSRTGSRRASPLSLENVEFIDAEGRMREGQRPSRSPSPPPALSAAQRSASRLTQEHELTSRDLNGAVFSGPISQVAAAEKKV
jgi:hypothetical protein